MRYKSIKTANPKCGRAQCFLEGIIIVHHRRLPPLRGLTDNMAHHSSTKCTIIRHIVDAEAGELSVETHVSVTQVRRHFLVQAVFVIEHAQVTCTTESVQARTCPLALSVSLPHPEYIDLYRCKD